jgi:SAM-dependent methyltransferase
MSAEGALRATLRRLPGVQSLRTLAFRTGTIKWWWRWRHLIDGSYREAPPPTDAVDPHREQLWSLIAPFDPGSLIEVGCGDGANLALFARKSPSLRLSAIDVNPHAIGIAEQRVRTEGGTAGEFRHGSAERLPFPDSCADVALSDAVFMYLPPAQAVAALREMRRVARRAIVVHTFADDGLTESAVGGGNWVHPLARMIGLAIPDGVVSRRPSLLRSGQWGDFGTAYLVRW